jgi:hypothetical protein
MGWENSAREALGSPTLVGDTCFNDYPVGGTRDGSIGAVDGDFLDFPPLCRLTADFQRGPLWQRASVLPYWNQLFGMEDALPETS